MSKKKKEEVINEKEVKKVEKQDKKTIVFSTNRPH